MPTPNRSLMRALLLVSTVIASAGCDPFREASCDCPDASLAFQIVDSATAQPIFGARFTEGSTVLLASYPSYACTPADGGAATCSQVAFNLCDAIGAGSPGCIADGAHTFTVSAQGYSPANIALQINAATQTSTSCSCLDVNAAASSQVDVADASYPLTAIVKLTAAAQ